MVCCTTIHGELVSSWFWLSLSWFWYLKTLTFCSVSHSHEKKWLRLKLRLNLRSKLRLTDWDPSKISRKNKWERMDGLVFSICESIALPNPGSMSCNSSKFSHKIAGLSPNMGMDGLFGQGWMGTCGQGCWVYWVWFPIKITKSSTCCWRKKPSF